MLRTLTAVAVDAGYRGMVVRLDELRHVLTNSAQIRQRNWEQVLNLYNAAGNGEVHNLGVILAATDYTVLDPRAGMYSYEALRTRLASSAWSRGEYGHQATPVVSLKQLTVNEQAVLLQRVDRCHRVATGRAVPVTLDDITLYLDRLNRRVGAGFGLESMVSMRDICRSWVDALNAWQAHPEVALSEILGEEARSAQRRSRMNFGEEAVMPQRELMVADSLPVFDPAAIAERECGVSALDAAPDLAADFGVVR
jgi:hypothetical protein